MPKVQYTKMDSSLPSLSESTSPFSWCWKTTFLLLKYGIAFGEACCLKIQKCKSLIMRLTGRVPRLVPSGGQWWPSRLQGAADPPSPLSCSPGGIWSLSDSVSSAACTTQLLPSFSLSLLGECTRKLHYKQCFIFISNILTILDNKGVSTSII